MGKRDDNMARRTREFDSARLAALTKEKHGDTQADVQRFAVPDEADVAVALGRTTTLDDPMTTGLLAEVARRSQTSELDDDVIKEVLNKIDSGDTNHPHTRRRNSSK